MTAFIHPQAVCETRSIGEGTRIWAFAYLLHGARIGVLVDYEGPEEVGKDLAMHIAFAKPAYLNKAEIPQEITADEKRIQEARREIEDGARPRKGRFRL